MCEKFFRHSKLLTSGQSVEMSSPDDAFLFSVELVEGRGFGVELQALSLVASFGGETKAVRRGTPNSCPHSIMHNIWFQGSNRMA